MNAATRGPNQQAAANIAINGCLSLQCSALSEMVAAVRDAYNADTLWVDRSIGDQCFHAPGQIVLHFSAPLTVSGIEVRLAVTSGSSQRRRNVMCGCARLGTKQERFNGHCRIMPSASSAAGPTKKTAPRHEIRRGATSYRE
jgi:hypothetical protein